MSMPEDGNTATDGKATKPSPNKQERDAGKDEHVCVHCSETHQTQEQLLEHLQTCTSENNNTPEPPNDGTNNAGTPGKQSHMCMECGEVLSTTYSLKRHLLTHTGAKPHKCEFCGKKYKHAYLLNHHLNTHAGDRPFQCTECFKDFTSPNMLRRHRQVHYKQQHKCHHCDQQFHRIDYLDKHLATDHNVNRTHLCLICGKAFTFETMLQEHISMHNKYADIPEENLKCSTCNVKFSRISSLNRHKKQIHGFSADVTVAEEKSPYFKESENDTTEEQNAKDSVESATTTTDEGNMVFTRSDSLKKHLESLQQSEKEAEDPYQPVLSFPESKIVVQNKTDQTNHPCEKCGMEFTTIELLHKHKDVVHPAENKLEEELLRVIQDKMTEEKSKVDANTASSNLPATSPSDVKTELVTIDCPSCNTHFADAKSYENHLPICVPPSNHEHIYNRTIDEAVNVTTEKKIMSSPLKDSPVGKPKKGRQECSECGKFFADNYCLRRHMISHTGEKNYTCETCGKKFAHSFHLTSHKKIHLGIKDFRCEICGKTFTVKHALQRHVLTHPSATTFSCPVCQRKFATESSMQKHQLSHQLNQNDMVNPLFAPDNLLDQESTKS